MPALYAHRILTNLTTECLLQESHEGAASGTLELFGAKSAVIAGIGSLEAFLDKRDKFIFVQSSLSESAAAKSLALSRPPNSRLSRVSS
jgi:hypothetical protein